MKKRREYRLPLLVLSVSLNLAFIAAWSLQALSGGAAPPATETAAEVALHRELGVTAAQWQRIEPLLREFRQAAENQRQEILDLRRQFLNLLAASPTNEEALRAKQEEILAGQRRMQNLVIEHLFREKEILSPEQVTELIRILHEQCLRGGGMLAGGGVVDALEERPVRHESPDTAAMEVQ
jgi:Spy/CpxP family protein refolding chaperone